MRLPAALLAALLAAAGATVAACSGPGPSPSASPSAPASPVVDVCAIAPELPTIIGRETVAPPASFTIGDAQRCLWVFGSNPSRYVGVTLGGPATHTETIRDLGEGEPVGGLGDEARWWPATATLSVAAGGRAFQVDFRLDEAEGSEGLAVEIAQHVLERLAAAG